jgi:glycosyltransferase involved in cell wall biosynthesis
MLKCGVQEQCRIFERVPPTEVAKIVASSKVAVMLSRAEGTNKAAFEALFCNTPLIVYRGESMREVQQDDVLSRMVRFIEPVSDIATVLPQVDVLVMPSLWEACPLLPMEAMVLGSPVVGSDAIGLREVLRNTPSLAPAAGDARELASTIQEAMGPRSRQQAQAYASAARTRFDITQSAQSLLSLFDELTQPRAAVRPMNIPNASERNV